MQYIADKVPAKRLAPPNGTVERTKLQAWLNFFSSEVMAPQLPLTGGCQCGIVRYEVRARPSAAPTRRKSVSRLADGRGAIGYVDQRISPSCRHVATSSRSCVKNRPLARPRPQPADSTR